MVIMNDSDFATVDQEALAAVQGGDFHGIVAAGNREVPEAGKWGARIGSVGGAVGFAIAGGIKAAPYAARPGGAGLGLVAGAPVGAAVGWGVGAAVGWVKGASVEAWREAWRR